ncbi:MAG: efflux RND transporter periplasmic adaptor subunit [bacterium]|nr:efflux RND transporter periplasmic adaptor subunit [bacterium]
MRPLVQLVLFLVLLAGSALVAKALMDSRPEPETEARDIVVPLVAVSTVSPRSFKLEVASQGEVRPRTETTLASEVPGRVTFAAPAFEEGGLFAEDDVLLRLDRSELELALVSAEAMVRQAATALERERAEADVAARAYRDLGSGEASPLALRAPQLAEAEARVAAAEAERDRVELDLARTTIRAPYEGRVRKKHVGLGQVVARGEPLAELYATDAAEVRLLLSDRELARLDLPRLFGAEEGEGPRVELSARFAGREETWLAQVVRTEGELDPQTRMIAVVARVDDPYGRTEAHAGRAPLYAGLFVSARIDGRTAHDIFVLPRTALRGTDRVHVVVGEGRLAFRSVEILWSDDAQVVVSGGLVEGDVVVLTPLAAPIEGMRLEVDVSPGLDESQAER